VRTYGDAPARTPVALVDSYDRMEIAIAQGHARASSPRRGAQVSSCRAGGAARVAVPRAPCRRAQEAGAEDQAQPRRRRVDAKGKSTAGKRRRS
jgi:hypothetical protein